MNPRRLFIISKWVRWYAKKSENNVKNEGEIYKKKPFKGVTSRRQITLHGKQSMKS